MDVISFELAEAAAATKQHGRPVKGGEVMGIWVEQTSGTPTLDVIFTAAGQATTILDLAAAADGAYNPVRRMQTTAGANNSGAGEYQHFFIPPGATIKVVTGGAFTGKVQVVLR